MKRLRRVLLELWAILLLAGVVGFLGPFGTYLMGDFLSRLWSWWTLLMGAYVLVRPTMLLWRWIARVTELPRGSLVFWGVILSSAPMAMLWRIVGREETRLLGGYSGMLPFALLCSLAIMAVAWWAERADAHLRQYYGADNGHSLADLAPRPAEDEPAASPPAPGTPGPRLRRRLSPAFRGDILALESEDHYVRVHGSGQSELLFLRLRDAIAEMDGIPGEQTHRSWWVARNAVAEITGEGRARQVRLTNGCARRLPAIRWTGCSVRASCRSPPPSPAPWLRPSDPRQRRHIRPRRAPCRAGEAGSWDGW